MKKIVTSKLNAITMALSFIAMVVPAKEIELTLEAKTQYPISLHYMFLSNKIRYGGYFNSMQNQEIQYIYVNGIPDNDEVSIMVDKMRVANRTEFNDPCKIKLNSIELNAAITVGFQGNPATHGSFNCTVSKN